MGRGMILGVAVLFVLLMAPGVHGKPQSASLPGPGADPAAQAKVQQFMEGDSVFIENAGQWPEFIRFALDSRGANVGITDRGPRFQLFRKTGTVASEQPLRKAGTVASERPLGSETGLSPVSGNPGSETGQSPIPEPGQPSELSEAAPAPSEMHEFALVFDGAAAVKPAGRGHSDRKFNYLVGDASKHREGVGSFDAVWYENLYPGISLEMTGRRSGVKYNFHVAPGADCDAIRLRYEDIAGLRLTEDGALEIRVKADWEPLTDGAPYIYQEVNGEKRTVAGRFTLVDSHTYGFEVTGDYDPTLPLVIDPEVEWGTYMGGTADDIGTGVAADTAGNSYVVGYTRSPGWVSGGWDTTYNDGVSTSDDAFVVKFNSAGSHEWSTYLGGTANDQGYGIDVDSGGNCYAVGQTLSPDWVSGGWDALLNDGVSTTPDAFVVKLDSAGSHVWSTYVGGTSTETGLAITVAGDGSSWVSGSTNSSGWASGGGDTVFNGGVSDAYVAKLDSTGEHVWSTYLGGTSSEQAYGVAADADANCYVTGSTMSRNWVSNGWDVTYSSEDAFVVKLSAAGAHLWSTYMGGTTPDHGRGIAVDSGGDCYATGFTNSGGWVSNGWDVTINGGYDAYVVKFNASGGHLWSTFMGGPGFDQGLSIAVDSSGACYVSGYTQSQDWVSGGPDTVLNDGTFGFDGFVVNLGSDGSHLWSTYLGGINGEDAKGIAVDSSGTWIWVTGNTASSNWLAGGWDVTNDGASDAFLVKIRRQLGGLQVTLAPPEVVASGAQWRRVGTVTWLNSGDTELDLVSRSYEIEFTGVAGWTSPETLTVQVPPNDTLQTTAEYALILFGNLQVTLEPPEAVAEGAQWRRVGTEAWRNSGETETDLVSGFYDIEFREVIGWASPETLTVQVPQNGTFQTTAAYTSIPPGSIQVTLEPPEAVAAGAQWRRVGTETWRNSGETETNVPAGTRAVEFKTVDGWIEPLPVSVEVPVNGPAQATAEYIGGPIELSWGTYLGGSGGDFGTGVAVDGSGNCYATGYTPSSGWVSGGWDYSFGGSSDAYVVKLSASGAHLWSTYLGDAGKEYGWDIATDGAGACFAVGYTESPNWVSGGWDTEFDGVNGSFLVKLDSTGGHVWSTYLGGNGHDHGYGVAVDASGNPYVTGYTNTSGWVSGGWDVTLGGVWDAYVVKLSGTGMHLWSTVLGGTGNEYGYGIAVDSDGNCYATGNTSSAGWVSGGWDVTFGGGWDAYVVKLSNEGMHLWSTYVGGASFDHGRGIAVDNSGCYVTGDTSSAGWTSGGWDTTLNDGIVAGDDAYIVKLSNAGEHQWSTYAGGKSDDDGYGIAADGRGNCYVTGYTSSAGWTGGGWDASLTGGSDGYVVKLNSVGAHQWSSFMGGTGYDRARSIAVDGASATMWVTGDTSSSGWMINGWKTAYGGGTDAFVVKIRDTRETGNLQVTLSPSEAIAAGAQWRLAATDTWRNSGDTVSGITAGMWAVEFRNIGCGMKPGMQTVLVPAGGTATVSGVYMLQPSSGMAWSTYLGGTGEDDCRDIAVDSEGNCYVIGTTTSSGWVSGGWDTTRDYTDAFVVKLNDAGAHLWSTYLGGTAGETGYGIALDASGNVFAVGDTSSEGWLSGPYDCSVQYCSPLCYNNTDGFVVKLDNTGAHLWSTSLGYHDGSDCAYDVAVDTNGNSYITGTGGSNYWADNYSSTNVSEPFVVKLSAGGFLLQARYLNGNGDEYDDKGTCIAVNLSGDVYVGVDYYATVNDYIVKMDTNGNHLWSNAIDGTPAGIVFDASGSCYVAGASQASGLSIGGGDVVGSHSQDGYVVKLDNNGTILWSTLVGGTGTDLCYGIAVDASGNSFVTGESNFAEHSSKWVNGGWNITNNGDYDGFLAKLSPGGMFLWSTYLGGANADHCYGIAFDGARDAVWLVGGTQSQDWVNGGWKTSFGGGGSDGFVAKVTGLNQTGSLQVFLSPAGAVAAGAQWRRVTTAAWLNSGDMEAGVAAGQWEIEFKDVYGYIPPECQTVSVPVNGLGTGTAVYTEAPADISWRVYPGGSDNDYGTGIAVDSAGNCYATGYTFSSGWASGGWDTVYGADADAYVVKLDSTGEFLWSTYMGGAYYDRGTAIVVDPVGGCYATGYTYSSGWVSGGWDTSFGGSYTDGYLVKLDSTGTHAWSTYLGGTGSDYGYGVAVDGSGNCYVCGKTGSSGWLSGGWDVTYNGGDDAYMMKLNAAGVHVWSTYLGGAGIDQANGVAVGPNGGVYITGTTESTSWINGGWDGSYAGTGDGFVIKFTTAGAYQWSSYLGGIEVDTAVGIAVSGNDDCYVIGSTQSADWVSGGWKTALDTGVHAYAVKLDTSGAHQWSTYLYGYGNGIALDAAGNSYIIGYVSEDSYSSGWESGGWDTIYNGGEDVFLLKLNPLGIYLWSSYMGDAYDDRGAAVAVNGPGSAVWITGSTSLKDFENQGILNEGYFVDAFVAKVVVDAVVAPTNPGTTDIGLNTITWTWQDNSDDETGFKVYAGEGDTAPLYETWTTGANITSWTQDLLAANTPYTLQVAATNFSYDSPKTPALTAWTLIEPVAGLNFSVVGHDMISVTAANTFSNLAGGTSGLQFTNTTTGQVSSWLQNTMPWVSGGLTPNTLYSFSGQSRNGVGVVTAPATDAVYTLGALPSVGDNIEPNRTPGIPYPKDTVFEFVNPAGFGTSTHGGSVFMVSGYRYAWDTEPDHTFTGAEPVWNTGTLALSPIVSGIYYIHVQSLNEAGVAGSTLNDGPYVFDADALGAPVVSGPAFTNNPRPTWTWASGGGGNGRYRYDLDASGSWTETMDTAFTPVAALGDGTHTLRVQERDDVGNWSADGSFEILVDTISPVAPLVSGPVLTNNPRPTWTWTPGGGGNGIYRYELDLSGVWVEAMEVTFTPVVALGDGTHVLRVQERDDAGNWSPDGSFEILVDTIPPVAPVVSGPVLTNNPRPTWTWTPGGGGNGTYRYDLDALGVWVETMDMTFTPVADLGEGSHTLRVQERDDAGNWSAGGGFEVVVDTTSPAAPVVSGPVLTNNPRPTWTWTPGGGGNGTYRHDLDASGVWLLTTGVAFTPTTELGDGTHTLQVQERDDAGNWSAEGSHGLEINTTELTAAFSLVDPVETGADSVTFTVTFSTDVTPTFDVSVISVTGSLASTVSIEGTDPDYKVTVTLADPNADGTVGIAVAGGVVQDAYGNAYAGGASAEYQIYNWPEPWFTETPTGARKYTGDDHAFTARANCAAPSLTYQWNWTGSAGAERLGPSTPSWNLTDLAIIQSGTLWCEASYDGMTHTTPPVTLQVVDPLEIVIQPEGGTQPARDDHVFSVVTSGGYDPLHYQWRKDGIVVPEAPDSSSWTLTNLTEGHSGSYTVVVTDDNGMSVESLPAALVVTAGLAGPNAVLLAALILVLALFGGALLRRVIAP